jgi:ankyrin repeat protein
MCTTQVTEKDKKFIKSQIIKLIILLKIQLETNLSQMDSERELDSIIFNTDPSLNTLLHLTCIKKAVKTFRLILKFIIKNRGNYLSLISQKNYNGETFFQIAANKGCVEILEMFLKEKANLLPNYDPLIELDENLNTPLQSSILNDQHQSVLLLLNNGANVNIENEKKQNSLHLSCSISSYNITECLIRHGCNASTKDKYQMYPFDYACKNGNVEIVKVMLNLPDAHIFISNKPLDYAIENGHSGVTDILLRSNIWKSMMMYEENTTIRDLIQKMVTNFIYMN